MERERFFHRVWKVLEEKERITPLPGTVSVGDALATMLEHGFEKLPVQIEGQIEIFSYRSLSKALEHLHCERTCLSMPIAHFLEKVQSVHGGTELDELRELLDRYDAAVVPDRLQQGQSLRALLTDTDLIRYLDRVTKPFLLLSEIEHGLRGIFVHIFDKDELTIAIGRNLRQLYQQRGFLSPQSVEDLTLSDLRNILVSKTYWPRFAGIVRGRRESAKARLDSLASMRNLIFHFRRNLDDDELNHLVGCRMWVAEVLERLPREDGL